MKTSRLLIIMVFSVMFALVMDGQAIFTYTYPLSWNFESLEAGGPDLIQMPNNDGLTGEFTTRTVPASTCGQGGTAGGYFFEDDAGLQFNNPTGFIDQSYSLAFNFQIDEFISPPQWVRILSFTHFDDKGVYIKLTDPPEHGTLEFWPYGTVGDSNFFNTTDFYQLILVRNDAGFIKIYINGSEFAEYDDVNTHTFVPGDPDNFITFFRDHPSVLANEASPGFVSGMIIINKAWTEQEVGNVWDNFCSSLLEIAEQPEAFFSLYPNPAGSVITVNGKQTEGTSQVSDLELLIVDLFGRKIKDISDISSLPLQIDISDLPDGVYFLKVFHKSGVLSNVKFMKTGR